MGLVLEYTEFVHNCFMISLAQLVTECIFMYT